MSAIIVGISVAAIVVAIVGGVVFWRNRCAITFLVVVGAGHG